MWRVSKSLFLLREVGLSYIISTQELAALEHGKLKTVWISDDTERDTDMWAWRGFSWGLHRGNSPDTAFPLNTAAAHQQIQSKQLDLLKHWRPWSLPFGACHPPMAMTNTTAESCASNSELASTTHQVWGFYINSILLKRIVNNQRAPNTRRHKMLPGVQKPDRLFTRQIRA